MTNFLIELGEGFLFRSHDVVGFWKTKMKTGIDVFCVWLMQQELEHCRCGGLVFGGNEIWALTLGYVVGFPTNERGRDGRVMGLWSCVDVRT